MTAIPKETFFYVQLVDAELGKIRFGPTTLRGDEDPHETETDAEDLAAGLLADIERHGLETALSNRGIWGGLTVFLRGDDGTNIKVWEVEVP